ncbi:Beta-1,3-galactosyltransferase 1 [Pseudolycoriella hygida]|uniref:Hexosyltransferase n=1 Tax=Pseudolycoriella hygida TaxID=35572 RepID=A0A9Q0N303_9DIPT|nr:Beta-1,3-galactosyltransferase 1 [Pseudolycoriella hygida]
MGMNEIKTNLTGSDMWERRLMLGSLIGLTLCISIWRISTLEPQIVTEYSPYFNGPSVLQISNDTSTSGNIISYPSPISLDELPSSDYHTLIDLDNFKFLMNQEACNAMTEHPSILILIHSAPKNWHKRNVIRETWGRRDPRAKVLFLLGAVTSNSLQHKLQQENHLFEDMVQGNFQDAYRNMTYKHVMAFKWFSYFCPEAKFLLKTDDDVFVNTPTIFEFLEKGVIDRRNLLLCKKIENARVSRSFRSKWRVSSKEYSNRFYPTYCPGFSIIYSADTVFRLYKEAQHTPYFWIDDVHVTGTLAKATNLTITPIGDLYLNYKQEDNVINGYQNSSTSLFLFTSPNLTEKEIRKLWKLVSANDSS